jgi:hypothetical protein
MTELFWAYLLPAITLTPLATVILLVPVPRHQANTARWAAVVTSVLCLLGVILLCTRFYWARPELPQFAVRQVFAPELVFEVALNRTHLFLVMCAVALFLAAGFRLPRAVDDKVRKYSMALLVLETAALGLLSATNVFTAAVYSACVALSVVVATLRPTPYLPLTLLNLVRGCCLLLSVGFLYLALRGAGSTSLIAGIGHLLILAVVRDGRRLTFALAGVIGAIDCAGVTFVLLVGAMWGGFGGMSGRHNDPGLLAIGLAALGLLLALLGVLGAMRKYYPPNTQESFH